MGEKDRKTETENSESACKCVCVYVYVTERHSEAMCCVRSRDRPPSTRKIKHTRTITNTVETDLAPSFCAAVIDGTMHTLGPSAWPDDGDMANTDDSTVVIVAVAVDQGVLCV